MVFSFIFECEFFACGDSDGGEQDGPRRVPLPKE